MRNYSIKELILKNKGHELDDYAQRILGAEKELVLLGAEKEIRDFYERLGKELNIKAISVIGEKKGLITYDCTFIPLEDVDVADTTNIVCLAKDRKEYEYLRGYFQDRNCMENVNFFQGEIYTMVYEVYKKKIICFDRIEIFLTPCCTLNCEKCIAYIPYFENRNHTPLELLKRDADILFAKIDYVYKLKLLGGEGLLYPYLIEYIDYLYEKYGEKIGSIRIGTNGSIFPNRDILDMCRRNGVILDISDYSQAVPNICKINEVKKLCEDNGVEVDIKRTGEQWLDMGFPNNLPEKKSVKDVQEHYKKCAMFCRQFSNGKLYYCCSNFSAVRAGLFPENKNDYFDFYSDFTKQELLEYEVGYSELGHTTFCNVCRGCSEEANPCVVEVAKQMIRR